MAHFNTIVNTKEQIMLHAAHRNGSSRILRIPNVNKDWKLIHPAFMHRSNCEKFTHVKVIRDPYLRWRSWFYDFKAGPTNPNWTNKWSLDYAKLWVDEFKDTMHQDIHTNFQKVEYDDARILQNEIFLQMEDLDIFLGISQKPHVIDARTTYEQQMDADVTSYLQIKIPFLYNIDYTWMQNLPLWSK